MSIVVRTMYVGTPDATLEVEPDEYGDSYTMTLRAADGHVIASASQFRPGAGQDFGDDHAANTVGTFGAFLSAALEDEEFAASWETIADDASDWADALVLMGEDYEQTGGAS